MKKWLIDSYKKLLDNGFRYGVEFKLVGNIHDEVQAEVKEGLSEEYINILLGTFKESALSLGLRGESSGEGKIGKTWEETH